MPRSEEQNKALRDYRRGKILDRALKLFAIKGIDEVTVDDIMKKIVNGLVDYISINSENIYVIDWAGLSKLFAALFIMVASSNVCSWLSEFIGIKITKTYGYRLDNALKRKLDKLPLSFYDGQSYGDVLSTGVNDVDNIGHNTYGILSQAIQAIVML